MKLIKKNCLLLFCLLLFSVFLIGCGEQKETKEEPKINPYGKELGLIINYDRTFVCNLDYNAGVNYLWDVTSSIEGVVIKTSEEYNHYDDLDGGSGKYNAQFEADINLANDRRITLSFTYNTPQKTEKHPKTYEFELYVTSDGFIRLDSVNGRNLNGVDEAEHKWKHIYGQKVTCIDEGWTEYDECIICGERSGYEYFKAIGGEHDFVLSSNSAHPTKEMPAHSEYTCTRCGETKGYYANVLNRNKEEMNNLNILLIGNSYTNYNTMMNCLKGIIEGEGISVNIVKTAYGNQYLYDYIEGPDGDYYYKVKEAVEKTKFDIVFLQDQSSNPAQNPANFYDSVRTLYQYFSDLGTTCILYETWTRKNGMGVWSANEMAQRLAASYQAIGDELDISVSHCGTAVWYLMNRMSTFASHNSDNSHPSSYTSYLVALCHYATIYGRSPIGIHYTYNDYIKDTSITWHADNTRVEITKEEQSQLEQIAYDAIFGSSMVTKEYQTSSVGVTEKK